MTRTVIIVVSLALVIGGLMTVRDQFSLIALRAAVAACCGIAVGLTVLLLRRGGQ